MARSATQPQGAQKIAGAIQRDRHGQILDNLEGFDLINRLLDANHDSNTLDDLARIGQGLLGGKK